MITIIHNVYKYNPIINRSAWYNISSLQALDIEFQYLIFNDHGNMKIKELIDPILQNVSAAQYYYSDKNYGHDNSSGGWYGAVDKQLIKDSSLYIHNIGQDDFYTPLFYRYVIGKLEETPNDIAAVFGNCYEVNEEFDILRIPLSNNWETFWENPQMCFNYMFNPSNQQLTRTSNFVYAPGTIYRKTMHDVIGLPDLEQFDGSADFEYWARMVFYGYGFGYIPLPLYYYMKSSYSTSADPGNADLRKTKYNPRIQSKYQQLWIANNYSIKERNL